MKLAELFVLGLLLAVYGVAFYSLGWSDAREGIACEQATHVR